MESKEENNDLEQSDGNLKTIPRERAFLETFCYTMAQFQFDRARELGEREKDLFKPVIGSIWMSLLSVLINLANVEKSYFTMAFVERKILRRETIKPLYINLSSELKKISTYSGSPYQKTNPMIAHGVNALALDLSKQIDQFIEARLKMIDFYEFMAKSGWNHVNNTIELIKAISEISQEFSRSFHHPVLDPLKTSFTFEVEVIAMIFQTELHLSEWDFIDSLLSLRECQMKLHAWCMLSPSISVKEQLLSSFSYKSFFNRTNRKQSDIPFLYQWLHQFYDRLVAKFTFYFYTALSAQSPAADMKSSLAKTCVDYIFKLTNFQKKTDTFNISLVLDTSTKKNIFRGHGYHLDNTIHEQPTGMNSYPSVVSIPEARPKDHWPNVISMINDRRQDLNVPDKIAHFYDSKLESSYFLIKVDIRMTVALIYNSKKKERDNYIQSFLTDIRSLLNHDKLYHMLRPGQGKTF